MKRILFVRSGGGLVGLDVHTGIWKALTEKDIIATDVIGNSAGAIVSAVDAFGISPVDAEANLRKLTNEDVIRRLPAWPIRVFTSDYLLKIAPVRAILKAWLPPAFADLKKNLRTVAIDTSTGYATVFGHGAMIVPLVDAVQASMSISGLFPWTKIGDNQYADAMARANLPLPRDWTEFDEVWLLITSPQVDFHKRKDGVINRLRLNLDWLGIDQLYDVIDITNGSTKPIVHVVWPDIERKANFMQFNHDMIDAAYDYTKKYLDGMTAKATRQASGIINRGRHAVTVP